MADPSASRKAGQERTPLRPLLPSQEVALRWALPRANIALFMQMRLGKSAVAIRWAESWASRSASSGSTRKATLIVSEMSTLYEWERELRFERISDLEMSTLRGTASVREQLAAYSVSKDSPVRFALINYESLRASPSILHAPWLAIVLDESTAIRNPASQISKLLISEGRYIPHRAVLAGMPNPESLLDFWAQLAFIRPGWMPGTFWRWREEHFNPWGPGQSQWGWTVKPDSARTIRAAVRYWALFMTRKQVGIQERRVYETRRVPMNARQRKLQKQILQEFEAQLRSGATVRTKWATTRALWLHRLGGGFDPAASLVSDAKARELVRLLKGELKGEAVVVWCRYTAEILLLRRILREAGLSVRVVRGATPTAARTQRFAWFRERRGTRALVCQTRVARAGIDLAAADTAVYYSNYFDFLLRSQSEDRIVHPHKQNNLLYLDLETEGSLDSYVREALQDKKFRSRIIEPQRLLKEYFQHEKAR